MTNRLLVLGPSWLGDAVMAIPTYRELRRRFPHARLGILARRAVAGLYEAIPVFDEVMVYDRPKGAGRFLPYADLVGRLEKFNADTALVLPRSLGAAWTALIAGTPRRIGYATRVRRFLLTEAVDRDPSLLRTHRVHYYQHLLAPLGGVPAAEAPHFDVPAGARESAAHLLAPLAQAAGPLVVFNPGANYGSAKQWPEDRYAELGRRLRARFDASIVFVGGPGDRSVCDRIAHEIRGSASNEPILDLAGKTSILELGAVLAASRLVVTNDTGAMHVAQAVGSTIVAIFGSTDPVTTAPYGEQHRIVREPVECSPCLLRECPIDHRCMVRVDVDRVFNACADAFERP
ncbi:MAG: lipopolysaccharide heptosyltransferase II [Planctomycetes bacterium]|nr:lipopolysaccharide heptosyltransferase II [Planctomycetota bacterium]